MRGKEGKRERKKEGKKGTREREMGDGGELLSPQGFLFLFVLSNART